jgi:hypothetical protein
VNTDSGSFAVMISTVRGWICLLGGLVVTVIVLVANVVFDLGLTSEQAFMPGRIGCWGFVYGVVRKLLGDDN